MTSTRYGVLILSIAVVFAFEASHSFGDEVIGNTQLPPQTQCEKQDRSNEFAFATKLGFDSSLDPCKKNIFLESLAFLFSLDYERTSGFHRQIFPVEPGEITGRGYENYFFSHVHNVSYDALSKKYAYVLPGDPWREIHLAQGLYAESVPLVDRVSTFLHEARHFDSIHHVQCGKDNDFMECDDQALGAYGVETVFLGNLNLFCKNCTEKVKADAGLYRDRYLKRIRKPRDVSALQRDLDWARDRDVTVN